jgi:GNAT superfamily N-acetyltransferase
MSGIGRPATAADVPAILDTLTGAFLDDPVWGAVFPDRDRRPAQAAALWQLFVRGAARFPWTFVTEPSASVAIWLPPGEDELTHEDEEGLEDYLADAVGRSPADEILALFDQFAEARPQEPHFYLSLLATHPDRRGHGTGMALLRENLAAIDADGGDAYLESTNPANLARYESVGFRPHGDFTTPRGRTVTTMWRPANRLGENGPTI